MLKTIGKVVTKAIPLGVYRRLVPRFPLGLFYHVVSDERLPHIEHLYPYKSCAQFEQDLIYLKSRFELLSFDQLLARPHTPPPRRLDSIVVTFDDGFTECLSTVAPLLGKIGVPSMFFVTTDLLDNRQMHYRNKVSLCIDSLEAMEEPAWREAVYELSRGTGIALADRAAATRWLLELRARDTAVVDDAARLLAVDVAGYLASRRPYLRSDEVGELAAAGFTIGAHSRSHAHLGDLEADEVEEEIVGSSERVRMLTGQERVPFAFPFDSLGVDRALLDNVLARHPWISPLFDGGRLRRDREYLVPRVWADRPGGDPEESNIGATLRGAFRSYVVSTLP